MRHINENLYTLLFPRLHSSGTPVSVSETRVPGPLSGCSLRGSFPGVDTQAPNSCCPERVPPTRHFLSDSPSTTVVILSYSVPETPVRHRSNQTCITQTGIRKPSNSEPFDPDYNDSVVHSTTSPSSSFPPPASPCVLHDSPRPEGDVRRPEYSNPQVRYYLN